MGHYNLNLKILKIGHISICWISAHNQEGPNVFLGKFLPLYYKNKIKWGCESNYKGFFFQ
jgi:hypothetical protein